MKILNYFITLFKRISFLLLIFIWSLTIGFVGMVVWMLLLIFCGRDIADKWHGMVVLTGDPIMDKFFESIDE